jgi:hypothetical protein
VGRLRYGVKSRVVLMVSRDGHCLNDLLYRYRFGALPIEIPAIISKHRDFYQLAAANNIPFHHLPITKETKAKQEDVRRTTENEFPKSARKADGPASPRGPPFRPPVSLGPPQAFRVARSPLSAGLPCQFAIPAAVEILPLFPDFHSRHKGQPPLKTLPLVL